MADDNLLIIIKELGEFMQEIELFFVNITSGYFYLMTGFFFIALVGVLFYYIIRTKDWVVTQ